MKLKVLLLALFAMGLAASVAVASPPERKGKPNRSGPNCRPAVSFNLKGSLVSTDEAGKALKMHVHRTNKHGRAHVGKDVDVKVDERTKIRRDGRATLADLDAGDRLKVQVRDCKAGPGVDLLAKRVLAHPARPAGGEDEAETTSTETTPTQTTETTPTQP